MRAINAGITLDFLSQFMATLLQAVNKLRKSRAKNALSLTYGLVLELASLSYGGLETCEMTTDCQMSQLTDCLGVL